MIRDSLGKFFSTKYALYFFITLFLSLLISLPFLAPLLAHYGFKRTANVIYELYSFMCHQKAHRSFFIFDEQCAWCARDTFIWTTMFAVWIVVIGTGKEIKGINWKLALVLALPMMLDGGIQFLATIVSVRSGSAPFYESTNTIRAITGSLFGLAIGMFFFPRLKSELLYNQQVENKNHTNN